MDDDGLPVKKRRLQNACDECRKRKIKCDSANMPGNVCSNCLSFRTACTHVMAQAKKKRGPPRGTPRGQKTIQSIVKAILSTSKPYNVPDDPEDIRQLLTDLANRIVTLEEELEEARRGPSLTESTAGLTPPSMADTYYTSASIHSPRDLEECADAATSCLVQDFMKRLHLGQKAERHFGPSNNVNLLISALSLQENQAGPKLPLERLASRRLEFWNIHPWQAEFVDPEPNYTFPEEDLMQDLIELYFTNVNCYFPILHRGIFESAVGNRLHYRDRHFAAVLLVVCATGSRYSNDPRVFDDSQSTLSAGWKWYRQIRLVRSNFVKTPSVYELQLYCIAVFFIQGTSTAEACWIILAIGVRYAQDLGIHRKPPSGSKPTVETQLWNRAFWGLIAIDVVMSSFLGRPRATNTDDFDLPLPIDCDDEYWETEDPDQAFKQPAGKPSTMSFWVEFLKLLDIVGFAQRTIYAVRRSDMWTRMGMSGPEWNEKIVAELDSALNYWVDQIPQHLKWDPNSSAPIWSNQSTILYVTYYWVQILVHKPFISPTNEEPVLTFPSLSICANAARSCCHIVDVQQRKTILVFPTILNAIYSSAIILFLNTWRGNQMKTTPDAHRELTDVYKCVSILRLFESRSQVSGRFCDIINELLSLCGLPTQRSSSLKRSQREEETDDDDDDVDSDSSTTQVNEDSPSSSNSTRIVHHPRPIAGSKRAEMFRENEKQSEPSPPSAEFTFSLPTSSAELGSLPLHEVFSLPATQQQSDFWVPGNMDISQFGLQFGQFPAGGGGDLTFTSPSASGHAGSGMGMTELPESTYTNRMMAESLSSAFGNAGPGLPFGFEGLTSPTTAWTDWNSYLAGLDEMLQGFQSTV
ncbi:hypothetical protein L218DRAFT_967177 [Marasmius fiardii PR-910]|nr:hypothetical protein L218DRAFT_967177 [Marasmius fiardii PR-910]